jgi:hypothetical protein
MAKKKSALQQAAARRLQAIGMPKMSPQEMVHALYHAEEEGKVKRETQEDGTWGWRLPSQGDLPGQLIKPNEEMMKAYEMFARGEGHNH